MALFVAALIVLPYKYARRYNTATIPASRRLHRIIVSENGSCPVTDCEKFSRRNIFFLADDPHQSVDTVYYNISVSDRFSFSFFREHPKTGLRIIAARAIVSKRLLTSVVTRNIN